MISSIVISGEGGDSKTEQWTWANYLEETKAIAAPNKLFQEVHLSLYVQLELLYLHAGSPSSPIITMFTKTAGLLRTQGQTQCPERTHIAGLSREEKK